VFVNPGGPGLSGIDDVRAFQKGGPTNQRFDIVGFDPRGVGASRPRIDCVSDAEIDRRLQSVPAATPPNLGAFLKQGNSFAAGCRRHTPGGLLRHVSSADTARDMDLLRRAVGDPKLTYVGASYGTEIGAVYASLFPSKVRALVLDGGIDHRQWTTDPLAWSLTFAKGNEDALERFFGFCSARPDQCPFASGTTDPAGAYDTLIDALRRHPVPGTAADPRKLDGRLARIATLAAMHDADAWPVLGAGLAKARDGDPAILKTLADAFTGRDPAGHYTSFLEALEVVSANDGQAPTARAAYARHLRRIEKVAPHFADLLFALDATRRLLPVSPSAYRKPLKYPASAPTILVVGTTGDNATPYVSTKALALELGNARLLTRDGDGHTAFAKSACIADHIRAYLIDGTLPAPGTTCARGT
jgi:pimeloyl-ACP methyl ester carboxylesterase